MSTARGHRPFSRERERTRLQCMDVAAAIAVLPFDNPSGDPEQEYFARGFVEELATELARFPTVEVIHPRTSLALVDTQLPDELRGEYLVRGSVRRLGNIVRVAAQLIEAGSGRQVWADRFDAPAERPR
jgi:adenylate cyclase